MKKIILIWFLLMFSLSGFTQFGRELTLGAYINYIGGGHVRTGQDVIDMGYRLRVSPSVGYFLFDNFTIGVNPAYEFVKDEWGKQQTFEVLPFLRYYIPGRNFRLFFHLEGGKGWGASRFEGHKSKHHITTASLSPGFFIRISDSFSTELKISNLSFRQIHVKDKETGESFTKNRWNYRLLDFAFGIAFLIEI